MPAKTQRNFLADAMDNPACLSLILAYFDVYIL